MTNRNEQNSLLESGLRDSGVAVSLGINHVKFFRLNTRRINHRSNHSKRINQIKIQEQ